MEKVLIIDDYGDFGLRWVFEEVEFITALTTDKGRKKFNLCKTEVSVIFVDGDIPGTLSSFDLVKEMRKSFDGKVIAISGDPSFQGKLLEAGCNYAISKDRLAEEIHHLVLKKPCG